MNAVFYIYAREYAEFAPLVFYRREKFVSMLRVEAYVVHTRKVRCTFVCIFLTECIYILVYNVTERFVNWSLKSYKIIVCSISMSTLRRMRLHIIYVL